MTRTPSSAGGAPALDRTIAAIGPLEPAAMEAAARRLDRLTKPPGSLGRLETVAIELAGIRGELVISIDRPAVAVFAGDHGVTAQGVSPYPSEVTRQMVANFDADFDFGLFQVNSGGTALTAQLAADIFLDIDRAEWMLAGALATYRKNLASQCIAVVLLALLDDVIEVAQRVLVDLQEMRDARHAAQALAHLLQGLGLADAGFQLEVVPHTVHHHSRVQVTEHGTDVLGQLADETHPDRAALDGDLGKDFYD